MAVIRNLKKYRQNRSLRLPFSISYKVYYVNFRKIKEFMENESLESIIEKLIALFEEFDLKNWEKAYSDMLLCLKEDPEYAKYQLRINFGGMGSFNDLILHRDGVPLIEENDYLNELRKQLYAYLT